MSQSCENAHTDTRPQIDNFALWFYTAVWQCHVYSTLVKCQHILLLYNVLLYMNVFWREIFVCEAVL